MDAVAFGVGASGGAGTADRPVAQLLADGHHLQGGLRVAGPGLVQAFQDRRVLQDDACRAAIGLRETVCGNRGGDWWDRVAGQVVGQAVPGPFDAEVGGEGGFLVFEAQYRLHAA
jgi:hypothetical protein